MKKKTTTNSLSAFTGDYVKNVAIISFVDTFYMGSYKSVQSDLVLQIWYLQFE